MVGLLPYLVGYEKLALSMVHSLQVSLVKLEGPYDFIGLTWLGEPVIPNEIGWSECIRQVNRSEYWVAILKPP